MEGSERGERGLRHAVDDRFGGCICEKQTSRRAYRLTYKDSGQRTRIVYVPRARLPEIKRKIANYSKLRKLIEEFVEINIEIFKRQTDP